VVAVLVSFWIPWTFTGLVCGGPPAVPHDFPEFVVPGHEQSMDSLRKFHWLHYSHYRDRGRPMATLWDEWMTGSSLWPAVESDGTNRSIRQQWASALSSRVLDPDGYVATHQHASIAHQQGWPFPFWQQGGPGTWGWHFSLRGVPHNWDGSSAKTQEGWSVDGAPDQGIENHTWNIHLTTALATVTTPSLSILSDQSPFIQLRWQADGLRDAQPYLEWTTERQPKFHPERRFYFDPVGDDQGIAFTMIPVFKSPHWKGRITQLRIGFGNQDAGAEIGIQALFTQYDTRHNVNNSSFIRGCCQYFHWTRDLNFLRSNLGRMRLAMRYAMSELEGERRQCIIAPFIGHDGRSGIELAKDGTKTIHSGRGSGNNYWDILPMGYQDAYATIQYYDTLLDLARLEQDVADHPGWNLPDGPLALDPAWLRQHAQEVKEYAGKLFWNSDTGRFVAGIDRDGKAHDYGFTFVNCEAVHYDFATTRQAESIMQWLSGERLVPQDTSQRKDIYRWRFGPRTSTLRNIDWYGWYWYAPESLPWGGQVQDGGAVLGFSYHDLRSRLKTRGADNAWQRLKQILVWFDETQAAGGYRGYYQGGERGTTLQGGGTCGGLGLDHEFYESLLVPQIIIDGFLGFRPRADGFEIAPQLPSNWPQLTVTRIRFHEFILDITADQQSITVTAHGKQLGPLSAYLPVGKWLVTYRDRDGRTIRQSPAEIVQPDDAVSIHLDGQSTVNFERVSS